MSVWTVLGLSIGAWVAVSPLLAIAVGKFLAGHVAPAARPASSSPSAVAIATQPPVPVAAGLVAPA